MNKGASATQTGLSQAEPEVSALRASIPSAALPWKPMASAPRDGTAIFVRTFERMVFRARWQSGFLDGGGDDCCCWVAAEEGLHPDDWHDGACWENNADDNPSDPPVAWMDDTGSGGFIDGALAALELVRADLADLSARRRAAKRPKTVTEALEGYLSRVRTMRPEDAICFASAIEARRAETPSGSEGGRP